MADVSMRDLLETGVHFGHRTRKWNPKMKPFIFTERNGIHIVDLQQTLKALNAATALVHDKIAGGGTIMFVGTKRQAQETIMREAERCGMPYVNQRWLGGTLTNWRTIRQRIDHLKALEGRRDRGEFELLVKKEALMLTREIEKLDYRLSGIREMTRLPDMLFVVDVHREHTAVREANILSIPIVAIVDTNCDPDQVDHIIPANDDAIRAIKLLTATIADAVLEGVGVRKDVEVEVPAETVDLEAMAEGTDEALLGEATLAKLQDGSLDFGDKKPEEAAEKQADAEAPEETVAEAEAAEEQPAEGETQPAEVVAEEAVAEAEAPEETVAEAEVAEEQPAEDAAAAEEETQPAEAVAEEAAPADDDE
jgi:small subunit ribosomal protein S2